MEPFKESTITFVRPEKPEIRVQVQSSNGQLVWCSVYHGDTIKVIVHHGVAESQHGLIEVANLIENVGTPEARIYVRVPRAWFCFFDPCELNT